MVLGLGDRAGGGKRGGVGGGGRIYFSIKYDYTACKYEFRQEIFNLTAGWSVLSLFIIICRLYRLCG